VGGADGDEEAGGFKAEGLDAGVGGGGAGDLGVGRGGDGERGGMAVDEGDGGGGSVGELDGEAEAEAGAGEAKLVLADLVEEAGAVAEDDGDARGGVPEDVAEAAEAGKSGAIWSQSEWKATSSGVPMVSRRWAETGMGPE
jgi:hypothetical protein